MVRLISLLFIALFSVQAVMAQELTVPEELEAYSTGYPQAPVIQCPRPKKKYEDMLSQLDGIKQKIKGEACPQGKVDAIKQEVDSLESILTSGRKNFIELIKKGTVEGGQLSPQEVESLQSYIDDIVKKTASVTGLVSNPACFDEDEKVSTLSTLSSLIGDVSGAIGALAGPFGAKISLGGKLAAGLLSSIDTIVQARKTYDYDVYEDRKNYLHNLCAYYQFKGDIDKESKVFDYMDRLYLVKDRADQLLNKLAENCQECQEVIGDYLQRVSRDSDDLTAGLSDDFSPFQGPSRRTADFSLSELRQIYFPGTAGAEVHPELTGRFDLPAATITALQAKAWAETEMQSVQFNDTEGLSDEGRREVMRVQKQIEAFLVDREGSRYVSYYRNTLSKDFYNLERMTNTIMYRLNHLRVIKDPGYDYRQGRSNIANIFHEVFRKDLQFQTVESGYINQDVIDKFIQESQDQLKRSLQTVRVDYSILEQRCLFFNYSRFDYTPPMERQCVRGGKVLDEIKQMIEQLRQTSFAGRYSYFLDFVDNQDKNWAADWVDSITEVMELQASKL